MTTRYLFSPENNGKPGLTKNERKAGGRAVYDLRQLSLPQMYGMAGAQAKNDASYKSGALKALQYGQKRYDSDGRKYLAGTQQELRDEYNRVNPIQPLPGGLGKDGNGNDATLHERALKLQGENLNALFPKEYDFQARRNVPARYKDNAGIWQTRANQTYKEGLTFGEIIARMDLDLSNFEMAPTLLKKYDTAINRRVPRPFGPRRQNL